MIYHIASHYIKACYPITNNDILNLHAWQGGSMPTSYDTSLEKLCEFSWVPECFFFFFLRGLRKDLCSRCSPRRVFRGLWAEALMRAVRAWPLQPSGYMCVLVCVCVSVCVSDSLGEVWTWLRILMHMHVYEEVFSKQSWVICFCMIDSDFPLRMEQILS